MSLEDREKAVRRLAAVVAYEGDGRRDAARHAVLAGVGEPRFYKMMKAWSTDRSLLALVPQAQRRAARRFEVPEGIEAAAEEAVKTVPFQSQEAIAIALRERFGAPSLSWIRRLVARARRDLARERAGGANGFGRRLVIDSTALPLPLLPAEMEPAEHLDEQRVQMEWAVAAFVWDEATGFICGHALSRAPAGIRLHAAAASTAAVRLRRMSSAGSVDVEPEIASTLPLDERDVLETMRMIAKLDAVGVVPIHGPRAAGRELMTAFGGRLGPLDLRPRFAADTFGGRTSREEALRRWARVPMTVQDAESVLDVAVETHNRRLLDAIGTPAVSAWTVADGLERVVAAIVAE